MRLQHLWPIQDRLELVKKQNSQFPVNNSNLPQQEQARIDRARVDFVYFCQEFASVQEPRKEVKDRDTELDFESYYQEAESRRGQELTESELALLEIEMLEMAGKERPFDLFHYQIKCYHWLNWLIRNGESGLIEKCRDMGMTWLLVWYLVWCWLFKPNFSALLGSKKEAAVDNLKLDSLFGKLDYAIEKLRDTPLYPQGYTRKRHRTRLSIVNPALPGTYLVGDSQSSNFGAGGRYTFVFVDEYSLLDYDPWDILLPTANTVVAGGTARGENHQYALRQRLIEISPDLVFTMRWDENPYHKALDSGWFERMKARMTRAKFAQEVLIDYQASVEGNYYPAAAFAILTPRLEWREGLPSVVSLDYGVRDNAAFIWWQSEVERVRFRMMYCYTNNNRPIYFYIPILKARMPTLEEMERYQYSQQDLDFIRMLIDSGVTDALEYRGDPAGRQRNQETATSLEDILYQNGIFVTSDSKQNQYEARRDALTHVLMNCDVNEAGKGWQGAYAAYNAIAQARYPTRREGSQSTTLTNAPVHDWTSHYRSSAEYYAVGEAPPQDDDTELRAGSFLILGANS